MTKTELHYKDVELTDQVSKHYEKFLSKFAEIDTLPTKDWKPVHILAYICKRYRDYYGFQYTFKFNDPAPSKSYEVYVIKKLSNMLSADPQILKDYLTWIFDTKIIERKKKITSLGYFANAELVNDYKFKFLFTKKQIARADTLPSDIIVTCVRHGFHIKTYGELAFISKMPNQDLLFDELKTNGFQIDLLDKIV